MLNNKFIKEKVYDRFFYWVDEILFTGSLAERFLLCSFVLIICIPTPNHLS